MEGLHEKKEKQMRRTIVLLTTMAMTLLVATSVAMAAVITCPTAQNPPGTCRGTANADTMTGTNGTFRDAPGENLHGDIIDSFRGGDTLNARKANDTLNGGQGNDALNGGQGNDSLDGGEGNDTYLFQDSWGEKDTITADASGNDTLDFRNLTQNVVVKRVPSSSYNRAKSGTNSLNWDSPVLIEGIIGGVGNDVLFGDTLFGRNGDITLNGAAGDDILTGSEYSDKLVGGYGSDTLVGSDGDDTIDAVDRPAGGADNGIFCGDGNDTVHYDRGFDFPSNDCEKKIGYPIAAPPTN
jgi:Ca2+-binding RTX toxin-like protein